MNGGAPSPYPGFGATQPPIDDPGFQPPGDPLVDIATTKQRALVINREIPNVIVQSGWTVSDVRTSLQDLASGVFDLPSQLHDAIAGDSRVQSALRSRSGGLLGRPIRFKIPERFEDDKRAKKCLRAWENHWPQMAAEPALQHLLETSHSLGFSHAQILWDTGRDLWKPYLLPWGDRFNWFHWIYRIHVAVTQDGAVPITPGDGHWVQHAPFGSYRGWMRGALRALAQWWLARAYALRDFARYCERHGFPILLWDTPFGADPSAIANGQTQLATIGQESVLQLPGSVDLTKFGKYDLRYLEPADENWQAFKALIEQCNDEITLALLGQNLTSQVKEGSLAAARVHADVRQAILEADARALAKTIYVQIARPFAALNFGDPELAPTVQWDVRPQEDLKQKADTFHAFASGIQALRQAGFALKNPESFARKFGLRGMALKEVPPVQIEAQLARATGQVSDSSAGGLSDVSPPDQDDKDDSNDAEARLKSFARRHREVVERARAA
jgi:phage gp29-like protein